MKKIFILLSFLCFSFSEAQDTYFESSNKVFEKKNEVRIGVAKLLSAVGLDLNYEMIKDRNQGFGASLYIGFEKDDTFYQNFSVAPYYRFYFTKSEEYGAKGFFVEGFADFYSGKNIEYVYVSNNSGYNNYGYSYEKRTNFFDIAAGVAIGKKWVNTSGFVFELKAGYGKNLLNNSFKSGVLRGDASIGYRF